MLTIKQATVVRLFEALGFKTAKDWSVAKLRKKVKQLPELADGAKVKNPKAKKALAAILKAKKVDIVPTVSEEPEKVEEPRKASKKKAGKEKATKKKKASEEKGNEENVDAFGRRLGTQGAHIDSVLSKKQGMTVEAIAKKTKLPTGRVSVHMGWLVNKGLVQNKAGKYTIK